MALAPLHGDNLSIDGKFRVARQLVLPRTLINEVSDSDDRVFFRTCASPGSRCAVTGVSSHIAGILPLSFKVYAALAKPLAITPAPNL